MCGNQWTSTWSCSATSCLVALDHLVEATRRLERAQPERRHALELDLGDDPERAQPDRAARNRSGSWSASTRDDRPVGQHEGQPGDRRRDALVADAGAVRAGGDGPGDGLPVDVAEVGQGQPEPLEEGVEHVQLGVPAATRTRRRARSTSTSPVRWVRPQQRAVGRAQRR